MPLISANAASHSTAHIRNELIFHLEALSAAVEFSWQDAHSWCGGLGCRCQRGMQQQHPAMRRHSCRWRRRSRRWLPHGLAHVQTRVERTALKSPQLW